MFGLLHRLNLDWQAKQIDEAGGIRLIINLILVEGSNLLIVQGIRGSNARVDEDVYKRQRQWWTAEGRNSIPGFSPLIYKAA